MKINIIEKTKILTGEKRKNFINTIIKNIYAICENDERFKYEEIKKIKSENNKNINMLRKKENMILKIIELQNETSKKLKVLDTENISKTEDLLMRLGAEL